MLGLLGIVVLLYVVCFDWMEVCVCCEFVVLYDCLVVWNYVYWVEGSLLVDDVIYD